MADFDYAPLDGEGVVTKPIHPYQYGVVLHRNSWYSARCEQPITIPLESFVRVIRYEGIHRLIVEPVDRTLPPAVEAPPFFSSVPSSRCGEQEQKTGMVAAGAIGLLATVFLAVGTASLPAKRHTLLQSGVVDFSLPPTPSTLAASDKWVGSERDRCTTLNIPAPFCHTWLTEVQQHAHHWHRSDRELLNRLARLRLDVRWQLGFYTDQEVQRQEQQMQALQLNRSRINRLTNRRFYQLFPRRRRHRIRRTESMTAQLWLACREEVLLKYRQAWE
jgi:hypothetical protein